MRSWGLARLLQGKWELSTCLLKSCPPKIQDLLHETVERDHSTLAQ